MVRKSAAALAAALLALVAFAGPATARDTGWDCPGCKVGHR